MRPNLQFLLFFIISFITIPLISVTGITFETYDPTLCNVISIKVELTNNDNNPPTYNGPASATVVLPEGLTYIHETEVAVGTSIEINKQTITWTIPSTAALNQTKIVRFNVRANKPGTYIITGNAVDDQQVMHPLLSEEIEILFPVFKNKTVVVEKNGTFTDTLTTFLEPSTSMPTNYTIQPDPLYGTITPDASSTSPYQFSYIPSAGFAGNDYFGIQVQTAQGCKAAGVVYVAVGGNANPQTDYRAFLRQVYNQYLLNNVRVAPTISLIVSPNATQTVDLRDFVTIPYATPPFTYALVEPTFTEGDVTQEGTFLSYTAPAIAVQESFQYKVTDAYNISTTGLIIIIPNNP